MNHRKLNHRKYVLKHDYSKAIPDYSKILNKYVDRDAEICARLGSQRKALSKTQRMIYLASGAGIRASLAASKLPLPKPIANTNRDIDITSSFPLPPPPKNEVMTIRCRHRKPR